LRVNYWNNKIRKKCLVNYYKRKNHLGEEGNLIEMILAIIIINIIEVGRGTEIVITIETIIMIIFIIILSLKIRTAKDKTIEET